MIAKTNCQMNLKGKIIWHLRNQIKHISLFHHKTLDSFWFLGWDIPLQASVLISKQYQKQEQQQQEKQKQYYLHGKSSSPALFTITSLKNSNHRLCYCFIESYQVISVFCCSMQSLFTWNPQNEKVIST